ncbi:MAG: hypothetical protein ACJ79K_08925 [Gemmatimonadaceae bacterium]
MTILLPAMHPDDEALSRLADQSQIERMKTRGGRHAARCGRCAAAIEEMIALGDSARALPDVRVPGSLLHRIERARSVGMPAPNGEAPAPVVPVLAAGAGARRHWMTRRPGAVIAAAASLVVVALVAPMWRRQSAVAAGPGEATMYPRYPKPGATVGLRFVPSPSWVDGDTLWAEATIDLRSNPATVHRISTEILPAMLVRAHDGGYVGRLVLPPDALSGDVRIRTAPLFSPRTRAVADLVLLTSNGAGDRPSLDAMENAVHEGRSFMASRVLADAFARWAPEHPMRWLVASTRSTSGPFDWLGYFTSTERRFARLTTRLNAEPNARAGELAGMAALAYRLEEPAAAGEWTERLMREHPDNPWALDLRVQQLHEMELRGTPRDSIARLLPSLDTLYERSGGQLKRTYDITSLVTNNGDSATIHRWAVRQARTGRYYLNEFAGRRTTFLDAELRDSVEAFAREVLSNPGVGDARDATFDRSPLYALERARAYSYLASVWLARGQYGRALLLTDSARVDECIWIGQDTRALALLTLGDTVQAVPFLAAFGKNSVFLTPDSAQRILGTRFNASRWQQAVDSVEAVRQSCRRRAR